MKLWELIVLAYVGVTLCSCNSSPVAAFWNRRDAESEGFNSSRWKEHLNNKYKGIRGRESEVLINDSQGQNKTKIWNCLASNADCLRSAKFSS